MSLRHRAPRLALASLLALALLLALSAAPASAVEAHLFHGSFGTSGAAAGQVSIVAPDDEHFGALQAGSGLAVNDETHDVYLADTANHRVDQFSSSGTFIRAWGWGVATGAAEFQTCTVTCQVGIAGSAPGQFESPLSVAVDNSGGPSNGDVYVADTPSRAGSGTNLIQKFDPSGNLLAGWGSGGQLDGAGAEGGPFSGEIAGIATDLSGTLFVNDLNRYVFEFTPDGTPGPAIPINGSEYPVGIAADPSAIGDLYWANNGNGTVDRLDSVGSDLGAIERVDPSDGSYVSTGLAVDAANGDVYSSHSLVIRHFAIDSSTGGVVQADGSLCPVEPGSFGCSPTDRFGSGDLSQAAGLAVDTVTHTVYAVDTGDQRVAIFTAGILADVTANPASDLQKTSATLNGHLDPDAGTPVDNCHFDYVTEQAFQEAGFSSLSSGGSQPCDQSTPISAATDLTATATALSAGTTYRFRVVASNEFGTAASSAQSMATLDAATAVTTGSATDTTNTSTSLNGSFIAEAALESGYWFEYGTTVKYGHKTPEIRLPGPATGTETKNLRAEINALVPNTTYHFRLVVENGFGTTVAQDRTVTTFQAPTIEGFSTSGVTALSAVLHAQINPQALPEGEQAECHFEYGPTTAYGASAPCPHSLSGTVGQSVEVEVTGLQHGVTYHFRVVAENKWGKVTSEDQDFAFFPPQCPNSAVRQQTGSTYLPDCRAYELVSPGNANGTLLFSGGPNAGRATSPSRFSYVGAFSSLPGTGDTIGTAGDLYVATRAATGWTSRYVGLPGDQAGCMSGPPNNPLSHASYGDKIQNFVLADPAMDRLLDWNDGNSAKCIAEGNGTGDANFHLDPASSAPYLWNADGALLAHLPSNLNTTPGAADALACPDAGHANAVPLCSGDVTASGDLSHLIFSSRQASFAENEATHAPGLTQAPGSAYDDDISAGTVRLISLLPNGDDIPQDPSYAIYPTRKFLGGNSVEVPGGVEEYIRFPAVSSDGSRVLMSTATAPTPPCADGGQSTVPCSLPTDTPIHLYIRVNDAVTYEIAENVATGEPSAVTYVGTAEDASKVYFTSADQLDPADKDHSVDLYLWSAEKAEHAEPPLTLISKAKDTGGAPGEPGNSDQCTASWTTKCDVVPYSSWNYATAQVVGGNGISDTSIASANGDIYFYSPEQLDGDHGVPGGQNLYDFRQGHVQFVADFAPGHTCLQEGSGSTICSAGPIARLQVSPDDSHMAFVTADQMTSYDNTNLLGGCSLNRYGEPTGETQCTEMYSFDPASGAITCDSCIPSGNPPTTNVYASQDGLFMTDDGRTFFSTVDSLVPQDTNEGEDVYEFVDGRPQLITSGTGIATIAPGISLVSFTEIPGLVGVSADGTDVYVSTYDTLTSEDNNGHFLKFYDARSGGGFLQPAPAQPCAAAEECHGAGTEAPADIQIASNGAVSSAGNAAPALKRHPHRARRKKAAGKRHRGARHHRGGEK